MKAAPHKRPEVFPFTLIAAPSARTPWGVADARTRPIERTDYECCTVEYVYKGKGYLTTNGRSFTPGVNSVYFLHKHSDHCYWPEAADPWAKLFFVVDGPLMETLLKAYRLDQVHHLPDCPQLRKYFDEMSQLRAGIGSWDSQAAVVFHRFLEECHALLYGAPDSPIPSEILELKTCLDENLYRKVNLDRYCRERQRSRANMIRRFKKYYGTSPYDYLMRRRIEEACLMLRHTAFSVKEIASRLNFADPYYFSNYFKRKTGLAPLAYRRGATRARPLGGSAR